MTRQRLRDRLVDAPGSVGARTRARRWELLTTHFPAISDMSVLDLGGTVETWRRAPVRPAHVTVVNLFEPGPADLDFVTPLTGDACDPPEQVRTSSFDLVFSNSLLEHVGGHAARQRLADVVRESAPRYWVQTPYRYFPVEPHFLFPGLQFLPTAAQASLVRHWPLVHTRPGSPAAAMSTVQWTELVGIAQLRSYFPDARIEFERLGGLVKSLVAVRA